MKTKLLRAFLFAILLLLTGIRWVAATGNCAAGHVTFWRDSDFRGQAVEMCFRVNDPDFRNGVGPDIWGRTIYGEHDTVSSLQVRAPSGWGVCLYRDPWYG